MLHHVIHCHESEWDLKGMLKIRLLSQKGIRGFLIHSTMGADMGPARICGNFFPLMSEIMFLGLNFSVLHFRK